MSSEFLEKLMRRSTPFGVTLWVLIAILVPLLLLMFIFITISYICGRRRKWNGKADDPEAAKAGKLSTEVEMKKKKVADQFLRIKEQNRTESEYAAALNLSVAADDRWRRSVFGLEEIEYAMNGSGEENVVVIDDHSADDFEKFAENLKWSVKRFNSNISFGEFVTEAETMRQIRHKNLVKLQGYSTERTVNDKVLLYEKVDNGNLHHWLHECPQQPFSPLTWPVRMNIIQGIAKGLAYLHEDVEPQILHGSLKSSCILLDQQWTPKIADFGLEKIFGSEYWPEHLVTESFRFESLENSFTEKNDVYDFGVLIMEMITGKAPVDCNQSQPYLIEWVKLMVENQQVREIVDSKLEEKPSSNELKRILLIALRCVDPDMEHRPTMGQILHMLEPHDLLLSDVFTYLHPHNLQYH